MPPPSPCLPGIIEVKKSVTLLQTRIALSAESPLFFMFASIISQYRVLVSQCLLHVYVGFLCSIWHDLSTPPTPISWDRMMKLLFLKPEAMPTIMK